VIYGSIFIFTYSWLMGSLEGWLGIEGTEAGFWLKFVHTLLLIIGFLLVLFICYLLFTILGNIITAPFNEEHHRERSRTEPKRLIKWDLGRCIHQH
jgi:uncharacterized protein involved in cysteine biosynthesis